ncbi:hypothetical protein J4456_02225 [Candidatus Pacearchaeota archaeon]|nr:hypothetical protein [Candidatus Pacearchaeota archaeon]
MFFSKLVVDANILFSFFKKDSTRRLLLEKLLKKRAGINVPYITFSELLNNKDKIVRYSEISPSEFDILISSLRKRLIIFPDKNFEEYIKESLSLAPHKKDIEYFAISLSLNNCPIWSDEKAFKNQSKIKIFSTEELLKLVK